MDAIKTLSFSVPGKCIGTNAAYRAGKGKYYMTKPAIAFKERLRAYAILAVRESNWKKHGPLVPCQVTITVFNHRLDADSPVKLILDALQDVCYGNDRIVNSVKSSKAKDDGGPRVDITVTA